MGRWEDEWKGCKGLNGAIAMGWGCEVEGRGGGGGGGGGFPASV